MVQMLLRVLLIVIVVQHPYRLPVLLVLTEMPGHGPHGIADVLCVQDQMLLRHHGFVQFCCSGQCQHCVPSV